MIWCGNITSELSNFRLWNGWKNHPQWLLRRLVVLVCGIRHICIAISRGQPRMLSEKNHLRSSHECSGFMLSFQHAGCWCRVKQNEITGMGVDILSQMKIRKQPIVLMVCTNFVLYRKNVRFFLNKKQQAPNNWQTFNVGKRHGLLKVIGQKMPIWATNPWRRRDRHGSELVNAMASKRVAGWGRWKGEEVKIYWVFVLFVCFFGVKHKLTVFFVFDFFNQETTWIDKNQKLKELMKD